MCVANGAIDEDCNFKAENQRDEKPLFVTDMTKPGSVQFTGGDPCSSGLQVSKWSYRLNGRNWIQGAPNNFQVVASSGNSWTMQVFIAKPLIYCFLAVAIVQFHRISNCPCKE